jgi:hypothetical protein
MTKTELERIYLHEIQERYTRLNNNDFLLRSLARRYSEMTQREWQKAWSLKMKQYRDGELSVDVLRVLYPFLHFDDDTPEDLRKRQEDGARRKAQRDIRERRRTKRDVE